jgi:hypothetical protein
MGNIDDMGGDVKKSFVLNAILGGFNSRADGSLSLRFVTPELTPEEVMEVAKNVNTSGVLSFVDRGMVEEPPQLVIDKEMESKTPSQRLRGALYVLLEFKLSHKPTKREFEDFYNDYMEKIITAIKGKIDDAKSGVFENV